MPTHVPSPAPETVASSPRAPADSGMGASLLYNSLRAELLATQGQWQAAAQLMHDVAKYERKRPELYERATQMALLAGNPYLGLEVVRNWRQNFAQSADAARYGLQLHLLLRQRDAAVLAMRDFLRYTPAADLDAAMTVLPGYFALPREADKQNDSARARMDVSTAQALEAILQPYTQQPAHAATAWGVVANIRAQSGQQQAAVQAATQTLALDAGNANAAWVVLQALQAKGEQGQVLQNPQERTAAQQALASYVAKSQPSSSLRLRYAAYLIEVQQNQAALAQMRILTAAQAQSARFWLMQGLIEMEIAPQDGTADDSLQRAWQLIQQGEDDEQGALRDDVLMALSRLAQVRGDLPKALAWLQQSVSQGNARVLQRRAALLIKLGRGDEALVWVQQMPLSKDFDAREKEMLAVEVLSEGKQYAQAYARLAGYVQQHPKDDQARYQLALLAERKGDYQEMESLLRQVLAAQPKNAMAYNSLGYSLVERGERLSDAGALLDTALQLEPDNAMIQDSKGWLEFRLGNLSAARALLEVAFAALPDAEIAAHLGEVLWQLGEHDAARKVWRTALGSDPDNTALQATLKRLKVKL